MAKRKYVYFSEMERFGYTLQVIALTEEEAKQAMIDEYIKAFKKDNFCDPRECHRESGETYFDTFLDELYVEKREFGKVYWD